uniref:Gag-Pol polyprotein n=1 Tax=Tanacetum cinerariifolium TaxID=118510 RepID=A0A6L2JAH7_TANCI|nr:hypothetical protein [Tanacetum cinerariifolium]
MSTQQDIYAASSEHCPLMLNKENYVPWSSRLLFYAKSRPNGKLIYNSIIKDPYVRRMIPKPADQNHEVPVPETFHEKTGDDSRKKNLNRWKLMIKQFKSFFLVFLKTSMLLLIVVKLLKKSGFDIGIQEKRAKLFNEWERFTSTDRELIESYYHCFSKLMNDFKRNKHFLEKIASNLKFLNNLQPEWRRHVTIVHQTKDLHTTYYTQLYDFLTYNQKEVDDLRAERLVKTHDPLALVANSNNPFNYLVFHQDQPSSSMNMGQDRQLQMVGGNGGNQFRQYARQNIRYQNGYNAVQNVRNQNPNNNGNVIVARAEGNAIRNNEEAEIQIQVEEFDLIAAAADLDEIEEVNANYIFMANLQQASTLATQTDKAPVYDSDGSALVRSLLNGSLTLI